jgi:hypothetical protein
MTYQRHYIDHKNLNKEITEMQDIVLITREDKEKVTQVSVKLCTDYEGLSLFCRGAIDKRKRVAYY